VAVHATVDISAPSPDQRCHHEWHVINSNNEQVPKVKGQQISSTIFTTIIWLLFFQLHCYVADHATVDTSASSPNQEMQP
jgi:hypothetical protein